MLENKIERICNRIFVQRKKLIAFLSVNLRHILADVAFNIVVARFFLSTSMLLQLCVLHNKIYYYAIHSIAMFFIFLVDFSS